MLRAVVGEAPQAESAHNLCPLGGYRAGTHLPRDCPTAGEGQGLRRASGPLGIVVLGVPSLRLNVAQVWCFQACLQLEIMLISHTCSFFRALED